MNMQITEPEKQTIESGGNVRTTVDGIDCVVIRADVFERVQKLIGEEMDHEELRSALARSAESSDWNAPEMDVYDDYDQHKQ